MTTLRQADFVDRYEFGKFLNRRGLLGRAVEVGTHRGDFAAMLLASWKGAYLTCIDPWSIPPGYETQASLLPGYGKDRNLDCNMASQAIQPHRQRCTLYRNTSAKSAPKFKDASLDFVYIDGDHRREHVRADLAAWWPKVKPGGILAGHDFLSSEPYNAYEDVQPEVLAFARQHNLDVWIVIEIVFQPWSFYLVKPQIVP